DCNDMFIEYDGKGNMYDEDHDDTLDISNVQEFSIRFSYNYGYKHHTIKNWYSPFKVSHGDGIGSQTIWEEHIQNALNGLSEEFPFVEVDSDRNDNCQTFTITLSRY